MSGKVNFVEKVLHIVVDVLGGWIIVLKLKVFVQDPMNAMTKPTRTVLLYYIWLFLPVDLLNVDCCRYVMSTERLMMRIEGGGEKLWRKT